MTTKIAEQDPRIGKRAKYIGREVGMRITGVVFAVDRKYIWIRDENERERGCYPKDVKMLDE